VTVLQNELAAQLEFKLLVVHILVPLPCHAIAPPMGSAAQGLLDSSTPVVHIPRPLVMHHLPATS
jgi:hypothetical protein